MIKICILLQNISHYILKYSNTKSEFVLLTKIDATTILRLSQTIKIFRIQQSKNKKNSYVKYCISIFYNTD